MRICMLSLIVLSMCFYLKIDGYSIATDELKHVDANTNELFKEWLNELQKEEEEEKRSNELSLRDNEENAEQGDDNFETDSIKRFFKPVFFRHTTRKTTTKHRTMPTAHRTTHSFTKHSTESLKEQLRRCERYAQNDFECASLRSRFCQSNSSYKCCSDILNGRKCKLDLKRNIFF